MFVNAQYKDNIMCKRLYVQVVHNLTCTMLPTYRDIKSKYAILRTETKVLLRQSTPNFKEI